MKRIHLYGNWKMNLLPGEGRSFVKSLTERLHGAGYSQKELRVCLFPPFVTLESVLDACRPHDLGIAVGAQDGYFEDGGAYTGAVSMSMVRTMGCSHVLVGHSERRAIFGDGLDMVARKLKKALTLRLKAVLCFGETLDQREAGQTTSVVDQQLSTALDGISGDEMRNVLFAYEPVWAIGTGRNASPEDAQAICRHAREFAKGKYGALSDLVVLYGGSVNRGNSAELLSQPDVDGALVGGASLKPDTFLSIYEAFRERSFGEIT
jgi:triosephosphate isomerase